MGGSLDPRGPAAEVMADLWWLMLWLGAAVFIAFMILLLVGLRRRPPGEEVERPSIRRWLVGGGVVMPAIVLIAVFAATVGAMRSLEPAEGSEPLVVEIVGRQWRYDVSYPEQGVTLTDELRLPVGRPVTLRLTSADVIHSFWVPELGGKMDMLPDQTNTLVLQADTAGEYRARCAEFCGLDHAHMEMRVVAQPADAFASWMAERR